MNIRLTPDERGEIAKDCERGMYGEGIITAQLLKIADEFQAIRDDEQDRKHIAKWIIFKLREAAAEPETI